MNDRRCAACGRTEVRDSGTGTLFCTACLLRLGVREAHARTHDDNETLLGHLRTLNIIGEGPRGRVFLAEWMTPGGGMAALKCAPATAEGSTIEKRLELLDHASIATVHELGTSDAIGAYVITDYIPGAPITRASDRHSLSTAARLELWLQAADAIAYAHACGLPHLNLKPTNVLVVGHTVKVLDFERALPVASGTVRSAYRPTEQALAKEPDPRSDIFALGVLLDELVRRRSDAAALGDLIREATREDPSERPPSVAALTAGVSRYLAGGQ